MFVRTGEVSLASHHSVVLTERIVQFDSGEQLTVLELRVHHAHVPHDPCLTPVRHAVPQTEIQLGALGQTLARFEGTPSAQLLGRQLAVGTGTAVVSEVLEGWDAAGFLSHKHKQLFVYELFTYSGG